MSCFLAVGITTIRTSPRNSRTGFRRTKLWRLSDQLNSYCTDDYYGQIVANDPRVDLAIGRIPVQSADEARVVIDKIVAYEQSSPFDAWRNHITYVADDGPAGAGEDDGDIHTAQAEDLAESFTPIDFEKVKDLYR